MTQHDGPGGPPLEGEMLPPEEFLKRQRKVRAGFWEKLKATDDVRKLVEREMQSLEREIKREAV